MKRVFVNGTFDILHPGHLELLSYAKSCGDYLLVAIDSDCRVQKLKGNSRPVCDQTVRKTLLENLKCVDQVCVFGCENELSQLVQQYSPHVMIVGSDYKDKNVIGSQYAKQLKFYNKNPQYSTTKILNNYCDRRLLCR